MRHQNIFLRNILCIMKLSDSLEKGTKYEYGCREKWQSGIEKG